MSEARQRSPWFLAGLIVFAGWLAILGWLAWTTGRRPREADSTPPAQAGAAAGDATG